MAFGFNLQQYLPWFGRLPVAPVMPAPQRQYINALNGMAIFPLDGVNAWGIVLSGTWVGTLGFKFSYDNGRTYGTGFAYDLGTNSLAIASVTANSIYRSMLSGGVTHLMLTSSAWTSGTVVVDWCGTQCGMDIPFVFSEGDTAHAGADSGNPQKVGGKAVTGATMTAVAANQRTNAHFDLYGRLAIRPTNTFALQSQPAVNTAASVTQAAAGGTVKNVCTSITCTLSSTAAATAGSIIYNLRDGASGAGTILWAARLSISATAGLAAEPICLSNLWIEGSANTAMTLETSTVSPVAAFATVALTGTITQ